jgi:hypothetical protein
MRHVGLIAVALLLTGACSSSSSHSHSASSAPPTTASGSPTASPAPVATAAPATAAAASAPSGGPCIVGDWTSTSYAQQAQGATTSGGAGVVFTITATQMSANFSPMQPISFSGGSITGEGLFQGQEAAGFSPHPTGTSTGTFTLSPQSSNVTFESKAGAAGFGSPIKADALPAGVTGSWTCTGASAASLTVPTPQGPTTITLARDA